MGKFDKTKLVDLLRLIIECSVEKGENPDEIYKTDHKGSKMRFEFIIEKETG